MRAFRYALLHLARNIRTSITTLLSYLCVLAVIMTVQQSTVSRQNHLIGIAKALEISHFQGLSLWCAREDSNLQPTDS